MHDLQSEIIDLHRQGPDLYNQRRPFWGPGRFRLGYYHNNGAVGLSGVASSGLFEGPSDGRYLGSIQSRLAQAYKTITLNNHRDQAQNAIFQYIQGHYPEMYARYLSGSLSVEDVIRIPQLHRAAAEQVPGLRRWIRERVSRSRPQ